MVTASPKHPRVSKKVQRVLEAVLTVIWLGGTSFLLEVLTPGDGDPSSCSSSWCCRSRVRGLERRSSAGGQEGHRREVPAGVAPLLYGTTRASKNAVNPALIRRSAWRMQARQFNGRAANEQRRRRSTCQPRRRPASFRLAGADFPVGSYSRGRQQDRIRAAPLGPDDRRVLDHPHGDMAGSRRFSVS